MHYLETAYHGNHKCELVNTIKNEHKCSIQSLAEFSSLQDDTRNATENRVWGPLNKYQQKPSSSKDLLIETVEISNCGFETTFSHKQSINHKNYGKEYKLYLRAAKTMTIIQL